VLGSPDGPHADEYKALMEKATALSISGALRNPVNFWLPARLLSLDGRRWFSCTICHFGGPLWITHAAESIRSDMSGSPIVTEIGTAIGVVCTAAAPWEGGPNPRLTQNLLLRDPSCPEPQSGAGLGRDDSRAGRSCSATAAEVKLRLIVCDGLTRLSRTQGIAVELHS
jgi:hypothetical protein